MFFLFGGWRAKKLVKKANQHISQTQSLLEEHGADMSVGDRSVIEGRLE
jgi:hypothetical protein